MKHLSGTSFTWLWISIFVAIPDLTKEANAESAQCMSFNTLDVTDIIEHEFKNPASSTSIEFRNIVSSHHGCFAHFTNGHVMGTRRTINTSTQETLVFDEGIMMSTGLPEDFCWNDMGSHSYQWGVGGDEDLIAVVRDDWEAEIQTTYDACVIEFDFRCGSSTANKASFGYIFGSNEYYEYEGDDNYHDAFAFFLNGENIALLPDGSAVTIDNVNSQTNNEYFIGNEHDSGTVNDGSSDSSAAYPNIGAEGLTTKLNAGGTVYGGVWNHLKMVIADKNDNILDSYVILEGQSFTCFEDNQIPDATASTDPESKDESRLSDYSIMKWYPDINDSAHQSYSCIYDNKYSDWMTLPGLIATYLFDSEEECCEKHDCEDFDETQ